MLREYLHPYYLKRGLSNPSGIVKVIARELRSKSDLPPRVIGDRSEYLGYLRTIQDDPLNEELDAKIREVHQYFVEELGGETYDGKYGAGAISRTQATRLYALLRLLEPQTVVETGVCNGQSTSYILAALNDQGSGHLYSVDLPPDEAETYDGPNDVGGAVVPAGKDVGWFVPERLRDRWTLLVGDSREHLPDLTAELSEIDVFIHDSAHVDEIMQFEFTTVWDSISSGGLLFSHDIDRTKAFQEFATRHERQIHNVDESFAFIIK